MEMVQLIQKSQFFHCQWQFVSDTNEPACYAITFDCVSFWLRKQ